MSDGRPTDREMEEVLREVGAETRYPPTPDVSSSVRSRLESESSQSVRRRRWFESPVFRVAAALIVVAVLAIPTIPFLLGQMAPHGTDLSQSQSDGMQAGGGELERAPFPPSSAESVTSGSAANSDMPDSAAGSSDRRRTDFGEILDLTTEITPAEARRIIGGPLPRLRIDGAAQRPDALYAADDSVVLVYGPRAGMPQMGETGIGAVISYLPESDVSSYLEGMEEDYRRVGGGYWFPDGGELQVRIGAISDLPGGALLYESRGGTVVLRSALPESRAVDLTETS